MSSSAILRVLADAATAAKPGVTLVGVGPGDPQLLTVAAIQAIASAAVVAYPVARPDAEGMAAQIAAPWISAAQRRLPLLFPMVAEAEPRQQAWREAADALALAVEQSQAVVLLCEQRFGREVTVERLQELAAFEAQALSGSLERPELVRMHSVGIQA